MREQTSERKQIPKMRNWKVSKSISLNQFAKSYRYYKKQETNKLNKAHNKIQHTKDK